MLFPAALFECVHMMEPGVVLNHNASPYTVILFRSLTIELNYSELRCYFGDGLISRRFPLSEIVSASPVRNRWYYGWGIRLTPSGWMFNVSGLEAVELTFVSGNSIRMGLVEHILAWGAASQMKDESWKEMRDTITKRQLAIASRVTAFALYVIYNIQV